MTRTRAFVTGFLFLGVLTVLPAPVHAVTGCAATGGPDYFHAGANCDWYCEGPGINGLAVLGGAWGGATFVSGANGCGAVCASVDACVGVWANHGNGFNTDCSGNAFSPFPWALVNVGVACWSVGCPVEECKDKVEDAVMHLVSQESPCSGCTIKDVTRDDFDGNSVVPGDLLCMPTYTADSPDINPASVPLDCLRVREDSINAFVGIDDSFPWGTACEDGTCTPVRWT